MTYASFAPACYAPELFDCVVSCVGETDCAPEQLCGTDRLCASPEIAGRCRSLPGDAGPTDRDGGIGDAKMTDGGPDAPPPDDTAMVEMHIEIEGKGRVTVQGIGSCDAAPPQNGDCWLVVPKHEPATLQATAHSDWRFDRWTTVPCALADETCTFTPFFALTVGVKFRKDND